MRLRKSRFAVFALIGLASYATNALLRTTASSAQSQATPQTISPSGETQLRAILENGELPDLTRPRFDSYQVEVEQFYVSFGYGLPWLKGSRPTSQALAIISSLENAASRGLQPDDYDGPLWSKRISQLEQRDESVLIRFDVAVTISAMRYVSDLHDGRVNPKLFHFGLDIDHTDYHLSQFLAQKLVAAHDINTVLESAEPPYPGYHRTLVALDRYRQLAVRDPGEALPLSAKAVLPGDFYAGVPQLVRLLRLLGDLSPDFDIGGASSVYERALVDAVKRFQSRHGLEPTGVLDKATLEQLNTPLSKRVVQLELVLERWRWVPHSFNSPPVAVNIPEFRLRVFDEQHQETLSMKVIVGKAYHHKTPVFASRMTYVTFRPEWNVPLDIQQAEMLPDFAKHPESFSQQGYEIIDQAGRLSADANPSDPETREQLRRGTLRLRQKPGIENSLGLVKFGLPNEYDIYLHGTPSTELFAKSRRDFSHGCIRVEDPVALAAWVLRDKPQWTVDRIRSAMDGDRSLTVKLDHPIPVLIVYGTAVVMDNGEVRFFDDIYGYDAALTEALAERYQPTD